MVDLAKLEFLPLAEAVGGEVEFTGWLHENIEQLNDALGMDMEARGTEMFVGSYRADIVAQNLSGEMVVIEAQYGRTDHSHIGQLLTYAGGVEAQIIIWVAEEVREEHRAALDWLNAHTELSFFGVEARAVRIDGSRPAVSYEIVSSPNDWSRDTKVAVDRDKLSDAEELRIEYWQALNAKIDELGVSITKYRPNRHSWNGGSVGRSHVWLNYALNQRDGWIQVEIYLGSSNAKNEFDWLVERKDEIEAELGSLNWERLDHRKASRVGIRASADVQDRDDWDRQLAWIIEKRIDFDRVFRPIITSDAFPSDR